MVAWIFTVDNCNFGFCISRKHLLEVFTLQALLSDDDARLTMGKAAHTLATPNAAKDLASLTLNLI